MNDKHRKSTSGCGCSGTSEGNDPQVVPPLDSRPVEPGQLTGRRYRRPIETPWTIPRAQHYAPAEKLTEVVIARPGYLPVHAVAPNGEVDEDWLKRLEGTAKDLPTLHVGAGEGAVDIQLETPDGDHVKEGAVVLEGPRGRIVVPIDPTSRRFRATGLAPGDYSARGAAASAGRGSAAIAVRKGDVTRTALRLDGNRLQGTTRVRFAVQGATGPTLNVSAYDNDTGRSVFDGSVKISRGFVELEVPFGKLHWRFDDGSARSCYDADVLDDLFDIHHLKAVELAARQPEPDPPDLRFRQLGVELDSVARLLPRIGVRSLDELAAAEPEDLMHRAKKLSEGESTSVHRRMLGVAVETARENLGLKGMRRATQAQLHLARGETFARAFRLDSPGTIDLNVDLDAGQIAELTIHGPQGVRRERITESKRLQLVASADDVRKSAVFRVSLANETAKPIKGILRAGPIIDGNYDPPKYWENSLEERIRLILRGLAARNPGLGTDIPPAVLEPQNIQMWLDRARTLMAAAGVCSVTDLGRFRLNPMRILKAGAYVAPVAQPPVLSKIPAVQRYRFSEVLQNSVLFYEPNDILHETAVIMANDWDIRGQNIIIGPEVRELVVIVGRIVHDGGSRISWQMPTLPAASSYWPDIAPAGRNGQGEGAAGEDGAPGDPIPHPSKNGGSNAVTSGPIVTMYLRDASNNLPPLDLQGQLGGWGGRGQDGGRGGDGTEGMRADGTFFGGCCRGVGTGGRGGRGGDAGPGGKGGRGGAGGKVTVLTTPPGIFAMSTVPPFIDVNPGPGGIGGMPGSPGEGGNGGPAGSADCETWCDDHPERRGANGDGGASGSLGALGDRGPAVIEDQIQILPISDDDWVKAFTTPHILSLSVWEAEPGETVTVTGMQFDPATDRVFFDGVNVAPVASATQATFTVPLDSEGGYHPVVIRQEGITDRRSNRAMLRVLPKLDELPALPRWIENQAVTLNGLAFVPGLQVLAEDRSVTPPVSFTLPVTGVTRTSIDVRLPGGPLGNLRGVRRIVVRNPDGGGSRAERIARISDTIVVRCVAFRVVGTTPGVGTTRSAADIAALFTEGLPNSLSIPWQQARVAFRLTQPVTDLVVSDDRANLWPILDNAVDQAACTSAGFVPGALTFFFTRDIDIATAYAYFGGGPIFIGDEGGPLGPVDFQQVVAHEIGHALCLRHVCSVGEGPGTLFNRACNRDEDSHFLMYPNWDVSDGMVIHPNQIDPARSGATHVEQGKTAGLPMASLFNATNAIPQCGAIDNQN